MGLSEIIIGLISGVVGGIVANILYRIYTHNAKPEIEISNKLIQTANDGVPVVRAKIINKTKNDLVDISIIFYGIEYLDRTKKLKAIKEIGSASIPFLSKFDINDHDSDYAYQVSLRSKVAGNNIHSYLSKFEEFTLFVKATDVFNNSINAFYKGYKTSDIVNNQWSFDIGNTTNMQKEEIQKIYN